MDSTNRNISGNTGTLAFFMEKNLEDIKKAHLENTKETQSFDDSFENSRTKASEKIASSVLKSSSEFLQETIRNHKTYIKYTAKRKTIAFESGNTNQIKNIIDTYSLNELDIFKVWLKIFSENNEEELEVEYFSKKINSLTKDSLKQVETELINLNKNESIYFITSKNQTITNKTPETVKLVLEINKRNKTTTLSEKKHILNKKISKFDLMFDLLAVRNSDSIIADIKDELDKRLNINEYLKEVKFIDWIIDGETVVDLVTTIERFGLTKISPFEDFLRMVKENQKTKYDLYYLYNKIATLADKIMEITRPEFKTLNKNYRYLNIDGGIYHTPNDRFSYIRIFINKR